MCETSRRAEMFRVLMRDIRCIVPLLPSSQLLALEVQRGSLRSEPFASRYW